MNRRLPSKYFLYSSDAYDFSAYYLDISLLPPLFFPFSSLSFSLSSALALLYSSDAYDFSAYYLDISLILPLSFPASSLSFSLSSVFHAPILFLSLSVKNR